MLAESRVCNGYDSPGILFQDLNFYQSQNISNAYSTNSAKTLLILGIYTCEKRQHDVYIDK